MPTLANTNRATKDELRDICQIYGRAVSATASVNRIALQAFLDQGGNLSILGTGNYIIDASLTVPSNTVLNIGGAGIELDSGANDYVITNSDHVAGNENINIIGGIINGDRANQTGTSGGIYIENCAGLSIDRMRIVDARTHGIEVYKVTNFSITRNYINGVGDDCITTHESSAGTVQGNFLTGGDCATGGSHGVEVEGKCFSIVVDGNYVWDINNEATLGNTPGGILVTDEAAGVGTYCYDIAVTNNIVLDCKNFTGGSVDTNGIVVKVDAAEQTYGCSIIGNKIINSGSTSISISECNGLVCTDNYTKGGDPINGKWGIYAQSSANDLLIANNQVYDARRQGIYCLAPNSTVSNNKVRNHNIEGGQARYALQVIGDFIAVQGNTVASDTVDTDQSGINVSSGTSSTCSAVGNIINIGGTTALWNSAAVAGNIEVVKT